MLSFHALFAFVGQQDSCHIIDCFLVNWINTVMVIVMK